MAQGKSCIYFESFEKLFNELPDDHMRVEFHRALINRGLYDIPFPAVPRDTYWDGRLAEAYEYAEQLFSANEAKRAAGKKGGRPKSKPCLNHALSNVNVNDNENVNENANGNSNCNANDAASATALPSAGATARGASRHFEDPMDILKREGMSLDE